MDDFDTFCTIMLQLISSESYDQYAFPICDITTDCVDNYMKDPEHGLFHGLMACFVCYLIKDDANIKQQENLNQIYISLLLHDFLKCNNYSQEDHDKCLVQYYDKLSPITYTHSNPKKDDESSYIILCDRIELRRYDDYKDWVDHKYHNIFNTMESKTNERLEVFYSSYRPILLEVYKQYIGCRIVPDTNFIKLIELLKSKLIFAIGKK
jgi:hypothetical protein